MHQQLCAWRVIRMLVVEVGPSGCRMQFAGTARVAYDYVRFVKRARRSHALTPIPPQNPPGENNPPPPKKKTPPPEKNP